MKNILVITLGTREVQFVKAQIEGLTNQFNLVSQDRSTTLIPHSAEVGSFNVFWNKDFPDVYTFSPRLAGLIVREHYSFFRPIVDLPLIRPVLENLKAKAVQIDLIMLVYTDQQKGFDNQQVKAYNYNNDTLYFADIIQRYIKEDDYFNQTEFDEFVIQEEVTNVDFQYDFFEKQNKDLFLYKETEIEHVYLLPQGGIDQINQALTLKLIVHFKEKVIQFQNAEGLAGSSVYERKFPENFLNELNKPKIQKHLDFYDFGMIDEKIHSNRSVYSLAHYATKRLNLEYNLIVSKLKTTTGLDLPIPKSDDYEKLKDLYFATKIYKKQKKYGDFLWRMFTIGENLFKIQIEQKYTINFKQVFRTAPNLSKAEKRKKIKENYQNLLKQLGTNGNLLNYLNSSPHSYHLTLDQPARWDYFFIYLFLFKPQNDDYALQKRVFEKIETLTKKRNELAHDLKSVSAKDINEVLDKNYGIEGLLRDLDQILQIQNFGIYDQIKTEIEKLL